MSRTILSLVSILFAFSAFGTEKRLVILGDSLSEGYGVASQVSYPALLQIQIQKSGKNWKVMNASISGSTSASGPGRLRWQLKNKPDLLLLELGANDGLRGLDPLKMEENLDQVLRECKKEKVAVILAGMKMPLNYGKEYRQKFEAVFPRLAQKYQIPLIPFFLDGIAGDAKLNQADGIHPNEKGHQILAEKIYQQIKDLL
jgi:acyl-CoA thioesterase-1